MFWMFLDKMFVRPVNPTYCLKCGFKPANINLSMKKDSALRSIPLITMCKNVRHPWGLFSLSECKGDVANNWVPLFSMKLFTLSHVRHQKGTSLWLLLSGNGALPFFLASLSLLRSESVCQGNGPAGSDM